MKTYLIESIFNGRAIWLGKNCKKQVWTACAEFAVFFLDKESALAIIRFLEIDNAIVTEHIFGSVAA